MNKEFEFECLECGATVLASDGDKKVECPDCGFKFKINWDVDNGKNNSSLIPLK